MIIESFATKSEDQWNIKTKRNSISSWRHRRTLAAGGLVTEVHFRWAVEQLSKPRSIMSSKESDHFPHFGTLAIHAGQEPEQWNSRAVVPPISMATTFKQDSPGVHHVRMHHVDVSFRLLGFDSSDPFCIFRDLNIPDLATQRGVALKNVLLPWKAPSTVS